MSTVAIRDDQERVREPSTFRLTPEEVDELDQAVAEAEEEDRAGKLIPLEEVLAELRRNRT
jgi:hypothetical protein